MPKLMAFVACEKVIIDQDNNVSLITLLQELKSQIPESVTKEIPPGVKTMAAIKWVAFSMWVKASDDENEKEYQQRVALVDPSGESTGIEGAAPFKFGSDKTSMRASVNVLGFPIYATGRYTLRLWMHEKGQPESPEPIAEYPIVVKREQPKG